MLLKTKQVKKAYVIGEQVGQQTKWSAHAVPYAV
jgi:hypothetical protein